MYYLSQYGYHFDNLDKRHQDRFYQLVSEHTHAVNAAVSGISALPGTATPFAAVRGMTRFLNHPDIPFATLIEPAQDAARAALDQSSSPFALIVHDWSMFAFHTHTSKKDRHQRSHDKDLGYELGTALLVDAADGRPLGPMEFRLRTATQLLSSRIDPTTYPPGHVDELLEVMNESRGWNLDRSLVHVIDREADSVGHYRAWDAQGHRFLVRADHQRCVRWKGTETKLAAVVAALATHFVDVHDADGQPEIVTTQKGAGRLQVAQTEVVLHRPAKTRTGDKQVEVPGAPITLRLIVSRVVDELGVVRAEWWLFTNVASEAVDAQTIACWYAWRWRIETYHKLLKSAGMNAEEWQQKSSAAFFRRLMVASLACLTVWHLQRDESDAALRLRAILVRLSGRQMGYGVESTAPSLLAGLEKLLAIDDLMQGEDLNEVLALARTLLPKLFRSG